MLVLMCAAAWLMLYQQLPFIVTLTAVFGVPFLKVLVLCTFTVDTEGSWWLETSTDLKFTGIFACLCYYYQFQLVYNFLMQ